MTFRSLSWRVGLPFAAFVLAGSLVLVLLIHQQVATESRARLQGLAQINGAFLRTANLPRTARLAENLQQILGMEVCFRVAEDLVLPPGSSMPSKLATGLRRVPADGLVHRLGEHEAVALPVDDANVLVLVRPVRAWWNELGQAPTLAVLVAFWILATLVGWWVGRGLVRPLRNLANRLPQIEKADPLQLPEASRGDEIGDLARAFLRTRDALQAERRNRERAEKLAVLGRMTAALAHEIQNPVAAIKMHAQLWRGEQEDATAALIEREAERIDDLLSQWMFLSRPEPPSTSLVDLSSLLAEVIASHQPQLDHAQVEVNVETQGGRRADAEVTCRGDAKRLAQVFRNVLTNAIQAMPRGGPLRVTIADDQERMVRVCFEDSGRGFSAEALERCSEFFFSEREGGMGIGLSVTDAVTRAHGGRLQVTNSEAGGGCVTILLPKAFVVSS